MTRRSNQLSAVRVAALGKAGLYADGGGLYLKVTRSGTKSWIFRFTIAGKVRDMGLGKYPTITLSGARALAARCRVDRIEGLDPIREREQRQRAASQTSTAESTTFDTCVKAYLASHSEAWKNAKHRQQWQNTLKIYVSPFIGHIPVGEITTGNITAVLRQPTTDPRTGRRREFWSAKPETATRVRSRTELILDWAKVCGMRSGENPARWRGHLQAILPSPKKLRRTKHHAALPYQQIPELVSKLRSLTSVSARALEFLILTAARTNEVLGAEHVEFNLPAALWTVPAGRMKAGREHRVPLSNRALSIATELQGVRTSVYVFSGAKQGRPLSNMALLMLLRSHYPGMTVHGFRSAFKDWAVEQTGFQNFVSEAALAHVVGDKVEAAYRRSDLLTARRDLMCKWASFLCGGTGAKETRNNKRAP